MKKVTENTVETLFNNFLNAAPTGELAEAMHTISAAIDAQIAEGCVDPDTIADYEYSAAKYGFYAGFFAALSLKKARRVLD